LRLSQGSPPALWQPSIWLLIDKAPSHTALKSLQMAARLNVTLIWLPKQCSELNSMDHLWRWFKGKVAANRQFDSVDHLASKAEYWIMSLTKQQALRKAGLLSPHCWLKRV
jgi:transposase